MRKFKSYGKITALITGLLLTPQLATFADELGVIKDREIIISQNDENKIKNKLTEVDNGVINGLTEVGESENNEVNTAIDEKAAQVLRQMSDFIESQEQFSFYAETERDILTLNGVHIQVLHEGSTLVNRPNQFRAEITGELVQRELVYDGSKVTVVDTERNIYARGDVSDNMDETLDTLIQKLNINMPLAELLYSNIYEGLTKNVQAGFYFGISEVEDLPCHHLVFVQEGIDWQVWIEDSDTPLLRKVAIAYKEQEGVPRYTATLTDWNLEPKIAPDQFTFTPPANAKEVEFVQATPF